MSKILRHDLLLRSHHTKRQDRYHQKVVPGTTASIFNFMLCRNAKFPFIRPGIESIMDESFYDILNIIIKGTNTFAVTICLRHALFRFLGKWIKRDEI